VDLRQELRELRHLECKDLDEREDRLPRINGIRSLEPATPHSDGGWSKEEAKHCGDTLTRKSHQRAGSWLALDCVTVDRAYGCATVKDHCSALRSTLTFATCVFCCVLAQEVMDWQVSGTPDASTIDSPRLHHPSFLPASVAILYLA
jgi:hypothetical protein